LQGLDGLMVMEMTFLIWNLFWSNKCSLWGTCRGFECWTRWYIQ